MNFLSSSEKQAVIGDLLDERMFEYVLQLGEKALLVYDLQSLKVKEIGFEILSHPHNCLKYSKSKFSPNHRGHLHYPFETILQAVHTSRDNPLNRIGDLYIRGFPT